jgi:hypothetical protein
MQRNFAKFPPRAALKAASSTRSSTACVRAPRCFGEAAVCCIAWCVETTAPKDLLRVVGVHVYACSLLWLASHFAVVLHKSKEMEWPQEQGKRISWAVCMRSLYFEMSITLCFLDYANEQDVAGPFARHFIWTRRISRAFARLVLEIQKIACHYKNLHVVESLLKDYTFLPYITLFIIVKLRLIVG